MAGSCPADYAENSMLGLISDTHGLLRPEATEALRGAELIIHAGDVGGPEILAALSQLAPVIAVRGNIDTGPWAETLPFSKTVQVGSVTIFVQHDLKQIDVNSSARRYDIVVTGHSHKARAFEKDGVFYVNPGGAGPRRFKLPVTLALLNLDDKPWSPRFVSLSA
jgi:uncharacterized protein